MSPPRRERRHYVLGLSVRPSGRPAGRPSGRPTGRPSGHVFLYYANMVQQIKFIIYTNIQSLRHKFFTKGHKSKVKVKVKDSKKLFINAITWKIIIASLQFCM